MKTYRMMVAAALMALPSLGAGQGASSANATGVKKDVLMQIEDAEKKLVGLANAIPPAKFGWRPAPGVRSFSEVLIHVAMENLEIPPMAGAAASTTKAAADAEKTVTDKAAVVALLTKSFAYAKQSVMAAPDAQMDANASYFGTNMSKRGILIALAIHGHEHLGQLIAYARMNAIVPPWSQ